MYKKISLLAVFMLSAIITFAQPSQYTPMTAQGYQFKRILTDSTLHLPSFCGVPTLRNSTAKNGALAMDTCNNKLYQWTNQAGWTDITTGGIDTTSLSNRINLKVNISDTSSMLSKYLRKIDTTAMLLPYLRKVDTTSMLSKYLRKVDTTAMLQPYLQKIDTTSMLQPYLRKIDTTAMLSKYLRKVDTTAMLSKYLRKIDTTAMLQPYLRKIDTTVMLQPYLRKIDTSSMLLPYLRKIDTTSMLSKYLRKVDTTNKWVTNIISVNDTTFRFFKGTTSTDITIHAAGGAGSTPDLQAVTTVGATTDQTVTMTQYGGLFQHEYNKSNIVNSLVNFYPFYSQYPTLGQTAYIQLSESGQSVTGNEYEYFNGITSGDHVKINPNVYETSGGGLGNVVQIVPTYASNDVHYLPISDATTDTLATLADVRNAGGGGGGVTPGRFGFDTANIVMAKIHNNSGSTLTNGKVVFLTTSGTNSDAPSVRLANNKADSTSANTFGFVSGSIANNDTGWVVLSGLIEKLNTSAFSNGDIIYLDSISGQWTKSKPQAPYHLVYLGVVVKSNAGNGSIFVKPQNGYELDELHDVKITSKANNEILAYESSTNLWKNKTISTVLGYTPIAPADTANMLSTYARTNAVSSGYLISDATTTNLTATNTNLTFPIAAGETWRIMIAGTAKNSTTGGVKIAINAPTGATMRGILAGGSTTMGSSPVTSALNAINTLSSTFATGSNVEVSFRFEGVVVNSSTGGSVTLQFSAGTTGTATIYNGTLMQWSRTKGL